MSGDIKIQDLDRVRVLGFRVSPHVRIRIVVILTCWECGMLGSGGALVLGEGHCSMRDCEFRK